MSRLDEAKKYLEILREEQDKTSSLFYQLDKNYQKRLKTIAYFLDKNIINTRLNETDKLEHKNITIECDEEILKEKEITTKICKSNILLKYLGNEFQLINLEHPTEYGRVDIVGQTNDIIYPIEVKLNRGTHAIIGQIEKYMKHFWKKLGLKIWKDVKGIIIAKSYEQYVLEQLKNLNIIAFTYYIKNNDIELIKI
jgi:RecB family endonuclease NucS